LLAATCVVVGVSCFFVVNIRRTRSAQRGKPRAEVGKAQGKARMRVATTVPGVVLLVRQEVS